MGRGSDGRTPEDMKLVQRRFDEFARLTKELEPGSYVFEDILPLLPLDGGTPMPCGDTRFDHLQLETCRQPGATSARCPRVLRNGKKCARPLGHGTKCMSRDSKNKRVDTDRKRRAREREVD